MASASGVNLEDIIQRIGGCGRFQISLSFIVHSMKCIICFTMVAMVFGAAVPDWWCMDDLIGQNTSDIIGHHNISGYKSCTSANGTRSCSKILYADTMRTVVSEFDLLCDMSWVPQTITSIQMAGVLVGNLIAGQIADLIGRKSPLFLSIGSLVILNIISAFSTSWLMFAILRFFMGFAMGVDLTVQYNIQSEFTVARWRSWVVTMPSWAIELALFALVAWLLKDWQYILITTACVGAPLLATWWFVPESFRWYVSHNRTEEAEKVIKFIGKVNGYQDVDMKMLQEVTEAEKELQKEKMADKKYTIIDVLRHQKLLKYTLLLAWIWMTLGLAGYGIQFGIQKLSGSLYLNMFLIGSIGAPLQFVNVFLCNRLGRKKTAILFTSTSSIGAVLVGIFQYLEFENEDTKGLLANIFAITSLTLINAAWSPVQILTIEVYPTVVRNIGYGLQNTMARVGAIIGPQLVTLDSMVPGLMYFVCAGTGFISVLLLLPLPETKDAVLEDTIVYKNKVDSANKIV